MEIDRQSFFGCRVLKSIFHQLPNSFREEKKGKRKQGNDEKLNQMFENKVLFQVRATQKHKF